MALKCSQLLPLSTTEASFYTLQVIMGKILSLILYCDMKKKKMLSNLLQSFYHEKIVGKKYIRGIKKNIFLKIKTFQFKVLKILENNFIIHIRSSSKKSIFHFSCPYPLLLFQNERNLSPFVHTDQSMMIIMSMMMENARTSFY